MSIKQLLNNFMVNYKICQCKSHNECEIGPHLFVFTVPYDKLYLQLCELGPTLDVVLTAIHNKHVNKILNQNT